MFGRIFNPENAFFRTADKLADLVMLSLMWALCSIPLVTLGPATAALYDAAVKILRRGEAGNIYQRFFHSFRLNFKVGALTSLAVLAAAVLLYGLGNFLYRLALTGKAGVVLYYAYLLLLLLPIGMISYLRALTVHLRRGRTDRHLLETGAEPSSFHAAAGAADGGGRVGVSLLLDPRAGSAGRGRAAGLFAVGAYLQTLSGAPRRRGDGGIDGGGRSGPMKA